MGDKALSNSSSTKINLFWEHFIKAEANTYERGAWFDLFLAEALIELQNGNTVNDIVSFTSYNVAAVIANEIVSDIKTICTQQTDAEDLSPLREHLLSGRGWRGLALLHAIGLQEVTCGVDLAGLLISAYNIVDGKETKEKNPYVIEKSVPPIEQVCRFRIPVRHKPRSFSHSSGIEGSPPSRKISTSSSVHTKRSLVKQERQKNSSESDTLENEIHKSTISVKIRLDPMDFDYFTSIVRSDDDEKKNSSSYKPGVLKKKPKKLLPQDFKDECISKVFHQGMSFIQFRCLAIELLRSLCQSECSSMTVSVQSFNFSLEHLCTLQFSLPTNSDKNHVDVKYAMTRLFLSALDKVILDQESMNSIVQKGALPMMLRLLEDGIIKSQSNKDDCALSQDFIFGVIYAVINFMHSLLLQYNTPDKSIYFLGHFQQFLNSNNGRIVDKTVMCILKSRSIDEKIALNRVKKIIGLLSELILCLKQTRTKLVHLRSCKKLKHKNCSYPTVSHHHDNLFGSIYTNTILPSPGVNEMNCTITTLFMIFTRFLCEKTGKEVAIRTMQAMMHCGTCCCFPAPMLISRILHVIQQSDSRVRNLGLFLLEKTIYREVGAIDFVTMCTVCINVEEKDTTLTEITKHRWACLEAFQDMLLSSNYKFAFTIGSHLLRVTPRCSFQVQREMFFGVFYPVFITTKQRYISSYSEKDKFTIQMCLSAFTNLLNRMRFSEEFIERKAVAHIFELIKDRNFIELCCLILEILIIVHVWKLEKDGVFDILEENILELKTLLEYVSESTNAFLEKLQLNSKKDENNEYYFHTEEDLEDYIKILEKLNYFWRSWMNLCLYSPQVQVYFNRHLSLSCFTLLSFLLQHFSRTIKMKEHSKKEVLMDKINILNQLHLKIMESLIVLTVESPYSGNPGGVYNLKEKLKKVVEGGVGLRAVCDLLIRSAGAAASKKTMIPTHPMPKLESFEVSLTHSLEECNSESSIENSADEGYDADVDAPHRKIPEKESSSFKGSLPPSRKISTVFGERRINQVTHPELCHLALHLIVHLYRDEKWYKEAIHSLHKLSSILRDNQENSLLLSQSGFTMKLLNQFSDLLSVDSPDKYELQQAVLELFGYLAKHCIQPQELATFIKYFISDRPPLKLLLPCLNKLMSNNGLQPRHTINFPKDYSNLNVVSSTPAHKLGLTLHQQHMSLGLTSCWSRAAIMLPLNAELGWAMWVQGFSLSLWIRINPSSISYSLDENECYADSTSSESGHSSGLDDINIEHLLHIISIGYEALVLEFWADGQRELLHIRLTRPDGSKYEVLSEASLEGRLPPLTWHHLAISVHDSVHGGKVIIEVTLIIDGWCEIQVPLSFKGLLVRKSRPTLVAIGDTKQKTACSWDLGGLLMFRRPVLEKSNAIWLTALGPNISTVTQARVGNSKPLWQKVFSPRTLTAGLKWASLLDNQTMIKDLQDVMLLSYCPMFPELINVYPLASATLGIGAGFRVMTVEQRSSQLVPMSVGIVAFCNAASTKHCSVPMAVDCLGGPAVFLFLFARVVEIGGTEIEQAHALELYLRLIQQDPNLKMQSEGFNPLVSAVLESPLASTGGLMLKAILDTCCDKPGIIVTWGDELSVSAEGDFVLTDPETLVSLILSSSTTWSTNTLQLFLKSLLSLLRDDHPHREFNSSQLNRAYALEAILDFCKERLVEEKSVLDDELCNALVDVTRGLMTAPPQLSHVTAIADYLLLAHPAHATYISHARSSLYFVLPQRPPPKNKRRRRSMLLGNRNLSLFGAVVDVKEYRGFFTQPVDAGKLNIALNNLQFKKKIESSGKESFDSTSSKTDDSGINESCKGYIEGVGVTQDCDELSNTSANTYFQQKGTEMDVASDNSSNATDDDDKYINDNMAEDSHESEDAIRIGLLELLRDQILVTPDSIAHTALPNVLSPEAFIVMANHSNISVITAVVQVLGAYLDRANNEERARFIKDRGFYLLAMQLSHVIPTIELAEALASIVTMSRCLPLSLQLDGDVLETTLPGIVPLLSLIPRSVSDIPLAHNIIVFAHNVFLKVNDWKGLLEFGLVEALLKSLVSLMHQKNDVLNDLCVPEQNILVSDINSFLSTIVIHSLQVPGNNVQTLNDIIYQIEYVHKVEVNNCGSNSACSEAVKSAHCFLLKSALKAITEIINSHTVKPSFFSSVISLSSDDYESQKNSSSNSINTVGKLSKSDLADRFKIVVTKATEFVVYAEPVNEDNLKLSPEMQKLCDFVKEVWSYLLLAIVTVIERKSVSSRSSWSNAVWANKDTLRALASQMFLWLLSPTHSCKLKMFAISSILNEPRSKDILMFILSTSQLEKSLAYFLWDLRYGGGMTDSRDRRVLDEFGSKLEEWCTSYVLGIVTGDVEAGEYAREAVAEAVASRGAWRLQRQSQVHKAVYHHEPLAKEVSERAMRVTKEVESSQSHQRKLLMESIKNGFGSKVQAVFKWREVINMLTHQEAVWHYPDSYPQSWELDPTEGPARIRNRLKRCHLEIEDRYFRSDRFLLTGKSKNKPLNYIFEANVSTSAVLIDRLHSNNKIRHMCKASVITPDKATPGELLIGHCSLYFVPSSDDNTKEWAFEQIKELHRRRFELQERALEIFLLNGKTFFMAFESTKERDTFMSALLDCELCNRVANEPLGDAVELWREGHLTNWHYLTILNTLSGRSYNDLMQYPVLPFVLADYTSEVLDLEDPKSYRNLIKPMAIQEQKNEQHYINNYNYLKTDASNEMSYNQEPYHYSSHYSNSGIVLHFLVRLPPFTKMFLSYQDNNFDWPDRTFHSLHTTWRLTSSESATDVKELIPEFFFLPEFLCNNEHFDFGIRQSGEKVDNVVLPPWATNPRLFILIHRQAMESEHVHEFLPHWIDLVFGYKQVGKAAIDSINVFHPATYYGFDPESIEDPLLRKAWQTMVRMYGQTPKQLFRAPHPLVVQCLDPKKNVPQVIPSVKGLSWGNYVGSPAESNPTIIWQGSHHTSISTLIALLSNDVFGLATNTALLLSYTKESTLNLVVNGGTSVLGAALISWGHGDGVVRAKLRKEQIPFPAVSNVPGDTIALCTSVPDSNQLWVGYTSGKIHVYTYKFDGGGGSLEINDEWTILAGHRATITGIALSRGFSLSVSIADDGSGILWDMNTLSYVRSLPRHPNKMSLVSISETLGDIAVVSDEGTVLSLYSVNCDLVGSVTTEEEITSITFSCAPEGRSVNVVACGMADGSIRLWSTWDMTFVKTITTPGLHHPIICLAYSHDSQHLYVSSSQGQVVIWQGSNSKSYSKMPRFLNLTSLL